MGLIQGLIAFFGRFLLSLIFIASCINQILDMPGTELQITNALHDWVALSVGTDSLQNILTEALSWTSLLLGAAIFCQVIGGLCILLGIQVRFGSFLLIIFLIPVTLLFHHFWNMQGPDRELQMVEFMKNVSILGGLLILLAYGKCKKTFKNDPVSPKES